MKMAKKSLIVYASRTGNTEKVALSFKKAFEKKGWECDMFKVGPKTDVRNPPFNLEDYDFLCAGSLVVEGQPVKEAKDILFYNPLSAHSPPWSPGERSVSPGERSVSPGERPSEPAKPWSKIVLGPEDKKGVVFVTFSGQHLGWKEALPALETLALELEHLRFQCVGRFSCPGREGNIEGLSFKDLTERPNERDLLKAEIFMEEILEDID
jgi:hypothetical protein